MGLQGGKEVIRGFADHYVWFGWEMIIKGYGEGGAPASGDPPIAVRETSSPGIPAIIGIF
jgi:hypothetical protein